MSERVLVTGANGLLGVEVVHALREAGIEPIPTARSNAPYTLDVTDLSATLRIVRDLNPDAIIHCAAYTQVDRAEAEREQALQLNVVATGYVASACEGAGIPICALSSDFVFDGQKMEPYIESDTANPISAYGWSKWYGEESVRTHCPNHWIVRTSWLFGPAGKCFPDTILRAAEQNPELRVVDDQRGTPTYTKDLAAALVRLIQYPVYGTYHLANSADNGSTTWYEFAKATLELAGVETPITPISTDEWPTPAKRPANSALRCGMFEQHGLPLLRHWREALKDYIELRKAGDR